jgi:hypothetical protein
MRARAAQLPESASAQFGNARATPASPSIGARAVGDAVRVRQIHHATLRFASARRDADAQYPIPSCQPSTACMASCTETVSEMGLHFYEMAPQWAAALRSFDE